VSVRVRPCVQRAPGPTQAVVLSEAFDFTAVRLARQSKSYCSLIQHNIQCYMPYQHYVELILSIDWSTGSQSIVREAKTTTKRQRISRALEPVIDCTGAPLHKKKPNKRAAESLDRPKTINAFDQQVNRSRRSSRVSVEYQFKSILHCAASTRGTARLLTRQRETQQPK